MRNGLPALMLAAAMALTLAACNDANDSAKSGNDNGGQQTAANPATPDAPATPAAPAPGTPAADQQAAAPATPAAPAGDQPAAPADQQAATTPAAPGGDPVRKINELNAYYRAVLVDTASIKDPHQFTDIAMKLCDGKDLCQIGIWTDIRDLPLALPVKVSQLKYQAFTYGRNKDTKYEASLWNCDDYPDLEKEGCIPKPMR